MTTINFYRNPQTPWLRRGQTRDILYVKNQSQVPMQLQIRVNGYLMDIIYLEPGYYRRYFLKDLPLDVTITVTDVEEEILLKRPENRTYRQFDFFKTLGPDQTI